MRIQSSQLHFAAVKNINTKPVGGCPHGNPAGACPECMGGGGGGGVREKPKPTLKEQGLLTWADLMPFWYAMLAAKQRQEESKQFNKLLDSKNLEFSLKLISILANIVTSKPVVAINATISKITTPIKEVLNNVAKTLETVMKDVKNLILNQALKIVQLAEKVKNLAENLKHSILNVVEAFMANLKEKEQIVKEFITSFAGKFKKKFLGLISFSDSKTEKSSEISTKLKHEEF